LIKANITSTGKYLPKNIVTNVDFEKKIDTSDDWIQNRTGIKQRRIVDKNETTADMSTLAIKDLLKKRNLDPNDIDVIIVATITPDMTFPSTSALVQKNLSANNAWGFDISSACSGFLFGLETGSALIKSNRYNKVIVVGADTMSSILDYTDRNTCILFGDGAGAVLLEKSSKYGIIDSKLHIDGNGGEFLKLEGGGSLNPTTLDTVNNKMHYVYQNGKQVFKHAIKGMSEVSCEILKRNNLSSNDIQLFIPHQANKRIMDAVATRMGLKPQQMFSNIEYYANTTAATIPICIDEAFESGKISKNNNLIISSFGAGFSWGSMYIKWGI
tara:strand:+ start:1486 stop:2469 length:984 start_codon:yes stop_codon:yes gene_type:complete